jgi:hypothetical protein
LQTTFDKENFILSEPVFWNLTLDKNRLKLFVAWFLKNHGEKQTIQLLEELKTLGFEYATRAGISLGIEDLKIPDQKLSLLAHAEKNVSDSILLYRKGEITGIEKMQHFIETWHETSELLKDEVVRYFEKTDVLNPVYMMAFSGARGNLSQVRQLVGMRGLMADPQGKIIDFPIQSNFREGLTLTEYLISTYGARKGIVDTALRTATAGYLTRRLVDVAQHVLVSKFDCGTERGIFLFDMKEGTKTIYSFQNRLIGRVLNQDLSLLNSSSGSNDSERPIARRNQEITFELAALISKVTKKALVRSPLTCETRKLVCQLCYGWSLATSRLVSIGEAVGVIAGQSIGEPGTQLTMRTFHTGGVFSAGITEQIKAPFSGYVEYSEPIAGTSVRTAHGTLAFLTKTKGVLFLRKSEKIRPFQNLIESEHPHEQDSEKIQTYRLPPFTVLFARHGEFIQQETLLAQISALPIGQRQTQIIEQTIYASFEGEVYYNNIDLLEDLDEKYGERMSKSESWARVWVLSAKIYKNPLNSSFFPSIGEFVSKSSILNQIEWVKPRSKFALLNFRNSKKLTRKRLYSTARYQNASKIKTYSNFDESSSVFEKDFKTLLNQTQARKGTKKRKILPTTQDNIIIVSKYKIKKQPQMAGFFDLTDVHRNVKNSPSIRKSQEQKNSLVRDSFQFSNRNARSNALFSYPYHLDFRFRFIKFALKTPLFLPMLHPGTLSGWFKNQKFKKSEVKKSFHSQNFFSRIESVSLKRLKLKSNFSRFEFSNSSSLHPLILANSVPFYLKTQSLKSYLTQKKSFVSAKLQKTALFSIGFLKNKNVLKGKFSTTKKSTKISRLKSSFQLKAEVGTNSLGFKNRETTFQKVDAFIIKTPLLFSTAQTVTYSNSGYFVAGLSHSKEKDVFFSLLPLQNKFYETSTQTSSSRKLEERGDSFSSASLVENSRESEIKTQQNSFGLKNIDGWNRPDKASFYWFPKFNAFSFDGVLMIQDSNVVKDRLQKQYSNTKQKPVKSFKTQRKFLFSFLNLAQSYEFKNLRFQKSFPSSNLKLQNLLNVAKTIKKIPNLTHVVDLDSFLKKALSKNDVDSVSSKKRRLNKSRFVHYHSRNFDENGAQKYRKTSFSKPEKKARIFFEKSFSKTCNVFDDFRHDLKSSSHAKGYQDQEKRVLKKKKTAPFVFDSAQKNSVSFTEFYMLPQESFSFTGYVKEKLSDEANFSLPKKNRFYLRSRNPITMLLTNRQGVKKTFEWKRDGLISIHASKSKSFLDFQNLAKEKAFSVDFKTVLQERCEVSSPNNLERFHTIALALSKQHFLAYIKTKKTEKLNFFRKNLGLKNSKKPRFVVSLPKNKRLNSCFFTLFPFFSKNDVVFEQRNTLLSFPVKFVRTNDASAFNLSVKSGWFYFTTDDFGISKRQKKVMEIGENIVHDLYFNKTKVLLERTSVIFKASQNLRFFDNLGHLNFKTFRTNTVIKNTKQRFSLKHSFSRFFPSKKDIEPRKKRAGYLFFIRPFNYKILPSNQSMKKQFYRNFSHQNLLKTQNSLHFYKNYFSKELNLQLKNSAPLGNFASNDFLLKPFTIESVLNRNSKKDFKKPKSQKNSLDSTKNSKNLKIFLEFLEILSSKSSYLNSMFLVSKQLKNFDFAKSKALKPSLPVKLNPNFEFYLLNSVILNQYFVECESPAFSFVDTSFSNISLNFDFIRLNGNQKNFSSLNSKFKKSYLNLLLLRQSLKVDNLETLGSKPQTFHSKSRVRSFSIDLPNLCFDSHILNSIPVFEYSLNYKYSCSVAQRVFSSAFYKREFQQVRKGDLFCTDHWLKEDRNQNHFVTTKTLYNDFSDSFFSNPVIKTQFVMNKTNFQLKDTFSLTNFYSPYEGEVLKDYDNQFAVKHAEKSLNVYLDKGFQIERKTHKLLLTSSDIFSLNFQSDEKSNLETKVAISTNQQKTKKVIKNPQADFFGTIETKENFQRISSNHQRFKNREREFIDNLGLENYGISNFNTFYRTKVYKLKHLKFGFERPFQKIRLGSFLNMGDPLYSSFTLLKPGQIIHFNSKKITLRKAEIFSISPQAILHAYNGHCIMQNAPVMTLPFETLKTGDIVQGIPKVEQYLEARTTIRGRLFLNSLPFLLYAIYQRYLSKLQMDKAVRQSILKIQQILVDGVQRVYRSQGVSIADKHLEVIVRQMTSKVKITYGGQTGFFSGEFVELEFIERVNDFLRVKVRYEPIVLGITRASLEVDSFLSAASFQQTTKVLTRAALENKKDFLKGLKENLLVGNLLPAGTGYVINPIVS